MDKLSLEQRHKNMQAVKNKNTDIERILRRALWENGLRYRKNCSKVYGKPDVVFLRRKIAVFCDSEFWHGYDWENKKNEIRSNRDFWIKKIENNIKRDKLVDEKLQHDGWIVLRFWGKMIKKDPTSCVEAVKNVYIKRGTHV